MGSGGIFFLGMQRNNFDLCLDQSNTVQIRPVILNLGVARYFPDGCGEKNNIMYSK